MSLLNIFIWIIMDINGTNLTNDPFTTIFSPWTDILSNFFWIIPLGFICGAYYSKSENMAATGMLMLAIGVLMSSATMFSGYPEVALAWMLFAGLGIAATIVDLYFTNR